MTDASDSAAPAPLARTVAWCDGIGPARLILFVFFWVVGLGLLLQRVVLPVLMPEVHGGHGLIAGGDWLSFHRIAERKAAEIAEHGWAAWELRPEGQAPAGIASILYRWFGAHPLLMLPLNALVFAVATAAARSLLTTLTGSRGAATLGILPFLVFPSFVIVWGQIHKDVFSGAGLLIVLASLAAAANGRGRLLGIAAAMAAGGALIWLVRAYALEIATGAGLIFAVSIALLRPRTAWRPALAVLALIATTTVLTTVGSGIGKGMLKGAARVGQSALPQAAPGSEQPPTPAELCRPAPAGNPIDGVLFSICRLRQHFLQWDPEAGSNMDADADLRKLTEFLAYLPRAAQIAVLLPRPLAATERTSEIGRIGQRAVTFEMAVAYLAFALAVMVARGRLLEPPVLATILFALSYILVHVYALPNLGTLHRMRIFMFTALVGLGVSLAVTAFLARRGAARPDAADSRKV